MRGEMQTTITLHQVSCGTEVNVVQEGVPDAIPPEQCYLGWQESMVLLGKLVEAEIPDWPSRCDGTPGNVVAHTALPQDDATR
jgi:hypothetical protein